jgi:Lecithin retinol acyltransferase
MTRGDHIYVDRVGSTRHGIDVGDGRVIHLGGEPGMSEVDASIRCVTLEEFAQGGEVKVRKYGQRFGPEQVVARAEGKLAEGNEHLFGRDEEFFASWCVTGGKPSGQLNEAAALGGLDAATAADQAGGVPALGAEPSLVGAGSMADGPVRTWSLRREWSRGFTVMLVLLLSAAAATIFGGGGLVRQMQSTASQLHVESDTVAALRFDLHEHEQLGHKLLDKKPVDRSAFVRQQHEISHCSTRPPRSSLPAAA